ncbi:hypothetical protein K439DRAFT_1611834 [Ramaria rubella]|nr:hypothetical protein K439DRAFT_1611834 [Ramaria rubella]
MSSSEIFELEAASLQGVIATRYLSVAGLVVLLWDHCLTFEQERQVIWPSRAKFVKWTLLCNRYVVAVVQIINAHALSGISSWGLSNRTSCQVWWMIVACSAILSIVVCHGILVLKLWKLWDAQRGIMLFTVAVFAVTETGSLIAAAITAFEMWPNAFFRTALNSCALNNRPPALKVVWTCMVVFDLFVFAMVLLNGLSRPRGSDVYLLKTLFRDGIYFFFVFSVLGWMNLVVSIVAPASTSELGIFCIWALSVTIVTRMMINIREVELKRSLISDMYDSDSDSDIIS